MATVPLIIATLCYVWSAIALNLDGQGALGFTYMAYAAANVGLLLVSIR